MNSLRELRKRAGLSQQQLSELLGVNQTAISQWERGVTTPSSRMLMKLSQIFMTSPSVLLDNEADDTFQWNDPEIMEAVRESLPKQLADLNDILKSCSAKEQKQLFNILVQLRLVLLLEDAGKRQTALSMIHEVAVAVERLTSDRPQSASTDKPTTSQDDCL